MPITIIGCAHAAFARPTHPEACLSLQGILDVHSNIAKHNPACSAGFG